MTFRTGLLILAVTGALCACAQSPRSAANQPTAGSTGSETARYGNAPTVSTSDPAYAENGAPRASQPAGQDTAGAASDSGNYAPLQHQHMRGSGGGSLR